MNFTAAELLETGMVMEDDQPHVHEDDMILSDIHVTKVEVRGGQVFVDQRWDFDGYHAGGTRVVEYEVGELVAVA